ncbi:galactokinase [Aeromicrobium panaciterrae]|uniref:Galactokinase n=1 Tax=Aeromicrobium panaciterrae TaxID=363861 RepID=A0ABU1UR46_9ACTN|nr:galactokinase [Aeromicrobium panaciterrae]MDR7087659.1 galactokinase [Aeromicrobium panaciterrae]
MTDVRQWIVPGRVNLIGEHLDYNGGPVLPMAIDRTLTVKVRRRDDDTVNVWTDQPDSAKASFPVSVQPGDVDGWAAYAAGVVWAFRQWGLDVPGLDLVIESNLPSGAGLASSAALTSGIALAINELAGYGHPPEQLALAAGVAENGFVGAPTGLMDQYAVLLAESGSGLHIDFATDPPVTRSVPLGWGDAGLVLLVIATGAHHSLADGEYAVRRDECERAATELGLEHLSQAGLDATFKLTDEVLKARTRHVLTETARVRAAVSALNRGAWPQLGAIFTASHESLRDDFEVSCPELDTAVEAAIEAGALGARMTGGGFGGSVIALVPVDKVAAIRERVEARYAVRDWPAPEAFVVHAAGGARLV